MRHNHIAPQGCITHFIALLQREDVVKGWEVEWLCQGQKVNLTVRLSLFEILFFWDWKLKKIISENTIPQQNLLHCVGYTTQCKIFKLIQGLEYFHRFPCHWLSRGWHKTFRKIQKWNCQPTIIFFNTGWGVLRRDSWIFMTSSNITCFPTHSSLPEISSSAPKSPKGDF